MRGFSPSPPCRLDVPGRCLRLSLEGPEVPRCGHFRGSIAGVFGHWKTKRNLKLNDLKDLNNEELV